MAIIAVMGSSTDRYSTITMQKAPSSRDDLPDPPALAGSEAQSHAAAVHLPAGSNAVLSRAVMPQAAAPDMPLQHPRLYFNRELSWLDFNWRVLAQAMDARLPLLERVRYLAITQSNLDEFFAKRVGGLKRQREAGVTRLSPDGRKPDEQLLLIRHAAVQMQDAMSRTWSEFLLPALQDAGIRIVPHHAVSASERQRLHNLFRETIYPILTPLAVDPSHPFPHISNLSHSLAVVLRHPANETGHFARVKIPTRRTRWIPLDEPLSFIAVEEVVRAHVDELFPGMIVEDAYLFRVTRNADSARHEEEATDLVQMIAEELRQRRFAPVVRLEIEAGTPAEVSELLRRELEVSADDEYVVAGLQDMGGLAGLANLDLHQHHFRNWNPVVPAPLHSDEIDIFALLRAGDVLVHHPYDSFTGTVERFIEESAADPRVLAIKQTVYRTSDDSPVVRALMQAAERGKQVAVLVEVTARFDEERNLSWAEQLESSGAHVIYGVPGLKTHAKVILVVREEEEGIRTYCHIGTGNYNPHTARLYTDMGLLTASPLIGRDVVKLFHSMTGYATEPSYEALVVAPRSMRDTFEQLIENEIRLQAEGGSGRIIAKMNAIDDTGMIEALYRASRGGVQVDLIIRGHTRLRPGIRGVSDNIRVTSIVGRFLEHDRVFLFGNGGSTRVFIGSADWRHRNLEERVEAVVEVTGEELCQRLERYLKTALTDNVDAWDLDPEGIYRQRRPASDEAPRSLQELLMLDAQERRNSYDERVRFAAHHAATGSS